ncbi:MAG: hypothetical protein ABJQ84_01590 [Ekhidna sp.]|uniref:hypothetical protein n=1 Tax=Ekhidna sp. TaxID=2608089 RepID=UPI003296C3B9
MNYITHMNGWIARVYNDDRLQSNHISLYLALFQFWNINRFQTPIIIIREELMRLSKIGSANTYTKCIKQLDEWGYIRYEPSYNPMQGSRVHLYRFDKGGDNGTDKGLAQVLRPYIKHNKQVKPRNKNVDENKNFDEPL